MMHRVDRHAANLEGRLILKPAGQRGSATDNHPAIYHGQMNGLLLIVAGKDCRLARQTGSKYPVT